MGITQTVAPVVEPVTLNELKSQIRVEFDDEDDLLGVYLAAAREHVERVTRRQFVTATYQLTLDGFSSSIELPHPPLQSVSQIQYVDENGATQTLAGSVYRVITDTTPGKVVLEFDQTYPTTRSQEGAVTITYVAGYGLAAAVPKSAKQAILLMAAHLYENREPVIVGTSAMETPQSLEVFLSGLRVYGSAC